MSARQAPRSLSLASSRIVSTDSSRARSMNAQVLTMRHSASSARATSGNPASVSMPSINSESTWFFGQPSVVRWTFISASQYTGERAGPDMAPRPPDARSAPARPWRSSTSRSRHDYASLHAPVVRELDRDSEVLVPQQRDDLLEVVAVLARDADLVGLDRRLHLDLRVLGDPDDLLGLLDRNPLLERDLLAERAARRLLHLAVGERLERHPTLVETRLEDVHDRLELHVVGRHDGEVGLLERDLALRAFEIVARLDLPPRLVERIRNLLHLDLAGDVERVLGGHGPPLFERDDHDTLRRHEGEGSIRQPAVHRHFREAHRHRVLELVVHHGLADLPVLRVDRQDQARQRRQRLLRDQVEDPVPVGVPRLGRVQETYLELGAQATEPGDEARGGAGQRLG